MEIYQKIRQFRELNNLSQEDMAERLNMSTPNYAKIERGETKDIGVAKLEKIAQVFNMDLISFLQTERYVVSINNNNNKDGTQYNSNYYGVIDDNQMEIKELKLKLIHKDEIIAQLTQELSTLRDVIDILKNKS